MDLVITCFLVTAATVILLILFGRRVIRNLERNRGQNQGRNNKAIFVTLGRVLHVLGEAGPEQVKLHVVNNRRVRVLYM